MANVWRFVVAIFAVAVILGMLGIDLTPLLASATVIGATIGFGAQALVRDYLSGFLLTVEDQFVIGDTISVNGVTGTVEDLSLRVTRVRAVDGSLVYVPNGDIRQLTNTSRGWAKAVVEVDVPITSAADLTRAIEVVTEAAERWWRRRRRRRPGAPSRPRCSAWSTRATANGTLRVMVRANHGHRAAPSSGRCAAAVVGALADAGLCDRRTHRDWGRIAPAAHPAARLRAAAHMASTGGSRPGPRLELRAPPGGRASRARRATVAPARPPPRPATASRPGS